MAVLAPRSRADPAGLRLRVTIVVGLGVALSAVGAWLFYLTRGTTFWQDEWVWILYRRANTLSAFLAPHNQHLSLVPLLIYRGLLGTAGLSHYAPFRIIVIVAHLACVGLVFSYTRPRLGSAAAAAAGALILMFGPAWGNILWPFQMAWLISLASGLGALLMLDRGDRRGEAWACGLLALALASSGLGLALLLGAIVELLWGRRWRELWVVVVPGALYTLWWLIYQQTGTLSQLRLVPRFVANEAASAVAALAGLAGHLGTSGTASGSLLTFGRPLVALLSVLAVWRLVRLGHVSARVANLAVALGAFWLLSALSRAFIGPEEAWASRYMYVGGFLIVLLVAELARGISVARPVAAVLGLAVLAAVVSNVGQMTAGARYLRAQGADTRAELGAMDIARPLVRSDYVSLVPNFPFPVVVAGRYFAAERTLGTPAATPAEISRLPETARADADTELVQIHRFAVRPAVGISCVGRLQPVAGEVSRAVPAAGLLLRAGPGPVAVAVRRFGSRPITVGELRPGERGLVRTAADGAPQPWKLVALGPLRVCAAD